MLILVILVFSIGLSKKYNKWIIKLTSGIDIDEEKGKINKSMTILNELLTRIKKLEEQNQEINKKLDKLLEDTGGND